MNPRPLGPEPSALPTALHPGKKNRSSQAAAVWLGMRGSNSHGRSQSPLHYHYANPHRNHRCGRLPSTLIYYSVWGPVCQQLFQTFLQKSVKTRKSAQLRLTFLPRLRAPTALAGGKDARVDLGHGHRQRPHRRAEHERDDGHVPYPLFQLVGGVVLITAGDACSKIIIPDKNPAARPGALWSGRIQPQNTPHSWGTFPAVRRWTLPPSIRLRPPQAAAGRTDRRAYPA